MKNEPSIKKSKCTSIIHHIVPALCDRDPDVDIIGTTDMPAPTTC